MSNPTPSRYQWTFKGVSFDFYRLCEILGITHHAQAHALKKVIRAGRSVKPVVQDIDEAIDSLRRWREMVVEDTGEGSTMDQIRGMLKPSAYDYAKEGVGFLKAVAIRDEAVKSAKPKPKTK